MKYLTSAAVDDAMMWAKREFKDLCDRPRNNPLHLRIRRRVPGLKHRRIDAPTSTEVRVPHQPFWHLRKVHAEYRSIGE
jgi:hypothetical protein